MGSSVACRREGDAVPHRSASSQRALAKRLMDVLGATLGLGATLTLWPLIALAVKLDSRGPVLFGQERIGRGGRRFRLWKFRTMCCDAEAQRARLAHRNEMRGAAFKMADDPRVTRVGAFLRRHDLDELPQFWNVLRGEMSLVGPRPSMPDEAAAYEPWQRRRLAVQPGMTGLAQVVGRGALRDFDEVVRLDLEYIDGWSLRLDVRLVLRTLPALVRGKRRQGGDAR